MDLQLPYERHTVGPIWQNLRWKAIVNQFVLLWHLYGITLPCKLPGDQLNMKVDADLDALGSVLFSLLACSMRNDKPALRRAAVEAARTALMEIPDAYLHPKIRRTASGGFARDICKDALSLLIMPQIKVN